MILNESYGCLSLIDSFLAMVDIPIIHILFYVIKIILAFRSVYQCWKT